MFKSQGKAGWFRINKSRTSILMNCLTVFSLHPFFIPIIVGCLIICTEKLELKTWPYFVTR